MSSLLALGDLLSSPILTAKMSETLSTFPLILSSGTYAPKTSTTSFNLRDLNGFTRHLKESTPCSTTLEMLMAQCLPLVHKTGSPT